MQCLVTGATGFLGRYVLEALVRRHSNVVAVSRKSLGATQTVLGDITASDFRLPSNEFSVIYHLAGLAHRLPGRDVSASEFFRVNVEGTQKLLQALEAGRRLPEALVLVSTVAVYGAEEGDLLDESTPRRADDPYGRSKLQAEDLAQEWGDRSRVRIGIVRLPLVIGRGAPGNFGAMVRAISKGWYCGIGRGLARRSMVLADDVASVLPNVAEIGGTFHLTDGDHPSFAQIEEKLATACGRKPPIRLPEFMARIGGRVGDAVEYCLGTPVPLTTRQFRKLTSTLTFSDSKARKQLGWSPSSVLDSLCAIVDNSCQH